MAGTTAESLHCFAHLEQDISEVIPYLNAELGGDTFIQDPPSVTFKVHGKLIAVHPRKIAINALREEEEGVELTWEGKGKMFCMVGIGGVRGYIQGKTGSLPHMWNNGEYCWQGASYYRFHAKLL